MPRRRTSGGYSARATYEEEKQMFWTWALTYLGAAVAAYGVMRVVKWLEGEKR